MILGKAVACPVDGLSVRQQQKLVPAYCILPAPTSIQLSQRPRTLRLEVLQRVRTPAQARPDGYTTLVAGHFRIQGQSSSRHTQT
jgi:hypothetical protein